MRFIILLSFSLFIQLSRKMKKMRDRKSVIEKLEKLNFRPARRFQRIIQVSCIHRHRFPFVFIKVHFYAIEVRIIASPLVI